MAVNSSIAKGYLLGIGNPLLDISVKVNEDFLAKYGLKRNDAIMAEEKHMPLYKELTSLCNVKYIAGGSVQNTLRVVQWILKQPNVCTYFGCVGEDEFAKILKDGATTEGVQCMYQVSKEAPTGTCAVLVTGTHRSLCANLAAAQKFTPDHLATDESKELIGKAKIIYTSGFFLAVSPESVMQLARHAHENDLIFGFNLSATFISQFYKEQLAEVMPYVDVLFGNEDEADAYSKAFNLEETAVSAIAQKLALEPKLNTKRSRTVVITQGHEPTILIENHRLSHTPVHELTLEEIVDTNGAGDAFVGGFLAQMVLKKDYATSVKCGLLAAAHIIQRSGCTFEGELDFKPDS